MAFKKNSLCLPIIPFSVNINSSPTDLVVISKKLKKEKSCSFNN
jgi:hypothetical protein